ncbi:MAG: hypothetical protein OHK0031_06950 [Anaerolineales bacterium]
MNSEILRSLLFSYAALAAIFSLYYLTRRRLSLGEWFFWGGLTLALPVLGPFLAISARPGPGARRPFRRPTAKVQKRERK